MILHVDPGSSWLVRGGAASLVIVHIGAGCTGLLSGAVALVARKGAYVHRIAGTTFFGAMLTMALIGTCVAPFLPQQGSVIMGAFTCYLVATAWVTVRRPPGRVGRFEPIAAVCAMCIAGLALVYGRQAAYSPNHLLDDNPAAFYDGFAAVIVVVAASDLRLILRGGILGAARIARHLWRMCVALLIAATSFFLGQQQLFPAAMRGSTILFVPEIAVLALTVFWLARVAVTTNGGNDDSRSGAASKVGALPRTPPGTGVPGPYL